MRENFKKVENTGENGNRKYPFIKHKHFYVRYVGSPWGYDASRWEKDLEETDNWFLASELSKVQVGLRQKYKTVVCKEIVYNGETFIKMKAQTIKTQEEYERDIMNKSKSKEVYKEWSDEEIEDLI